MVSTEYKADTVSYKEVTGVTKLPGKHITYDIEVATRHRFYANKLLVSNCLGKYHPHGDSSVAGAIETLVHQNSPLVQGTGNWGGLLDSAAAIRYTNCSLSSFGWSCFDSNYLEVTSFVPNYDGKDKEPVVIPVPIPVVLLNGSDGIGVGVTTKLPTFTAESVVEALKYLFSSNKLTSLYLAKTLKPALKWGGRFVNTAENKKQWLELMRTGRATILYDSELDVDYDKKQIVITDWPPGLDPTRFIAKVRNLPLCARAYNSKGATTFTIECKKGSTTKQFNDLVTKVSKMTIVRQSYRMNVTHVEAKVVDGVVTKNTQFLSLGVGQLLLKWAKLRLQLEDTYLANLIKKQKAAVAYSKLLIYASNKLSVIFKALRTNDPDAYLVKYLKITQEQAKQILELKVRQLSKLDTDSLKLKLKQQLADLKELIVRRQNPKPGLIKTFNSTLDLISKDRKINANRKTASFDVH